MPTEQRFLNDASATVASTHLNNLANNAKTVDAPEFDNSLVLATHAMLELAVTFGSAPTDASVIDVYAAVAPDGSNYTNLNGASPVNPAAGQLVSMYLGSFTVTNSTNAQICHCRVPLFPYKTKFFFFNRTGQAFPASGSTVKIYPYTTQIVVV